MPVERAHLSRRGLIAAGIAGGFALAGCSQSRTGAANGSSQMADAIAATEAARPHSGHTVTASLTAQPTQIDLGGPIVHTLAYGDTVPGPVIRANIGDELVVTVSNRLEGPTSVHWHGIRLRNDMDGAAPATPNIPAGQDFTYRFSAPDPGTYWCHPHVGLEEDFGLYLPVVIDHPTEGNYDAEWIVVMDDWTDGAGKSPQQLYGELTTPHVPRPILDSPAPAAPASPAPATATPSASGKTPMPGMPGNSGGASALLGGDAGDVDYPYYLINGRIPAAATTFNAKAGQRIRIRFVNSGSDTVFRVALAGHTMTVTHTDGYPVLPTTVDALLIGMAERYDVVVTAADGVFPLVALAEGKNAAARAILSTGAGSAPDPGFRPAELNGKRIGSVETFTATAPANLGPAAPGQNLPVVLGGGMATYRWTINGEPYSTTKPLHVRQGDHPTITFDNATMMYHPIHLHGHTFQMLRADGSPGARKDTVIVLPRQKTTAVLVADNPGLWQLHCHNTYHQVAGMETRIDYVF